MKQILPVLAAVGLAMISPAAHGDDDVFLLEEQAMQAAVVRIAPSVVRIETFGGLEKIGRVLIGTGPTTGLVVSADGYIVSSAFNFVQIPSSILVTLPSGNRASAKIVARDHSRMLVLLKLNSDEALVIPQVVPRNEMVVGQWAIAVGRTFGRSEPNRSIGILSAVNRVWSRAIQTDAKISPSNYGGPLVDIHGQVLGVLVPMSPHSRGEVAGSEWYDSGIGFAVPLEDVMARLDQLKEGNDLYPGILGITLKGSNIYSLPAEIAACRPNSPAADAGLKAGDTIIQLDDVPIERQVQLRHFLGPRYAGDSVKLAVLRGDARIETTIELTDQLEPYEHPFLGILPMRDANGTVVVRHVYPGSPADRAGILPADRLVQVADQPITGTTQLQELLVTLDEREEVPLEIERAGQTLSIRVTLVALTGHMKTIPSRLPAPRGPAEHSADQDRPAVGVVKVKIPEAPNECFAYVPDNYDPQVPHGMVVWLHEPGGFDQNQLVIRWKQHCADNRLILVAPRSSNPAQWRRTELNFIRKCADDVAGNYRIDPARVVVHGYQAGGALAFLVAFSNRDLVRGVAAVDAPLPRRARPPDNDPIYRLAFYIASAEKSPVSDRIEQGIKLLEKMKYPLTVHQQAAADSYLDADELSELVRWIDTLDRI